MKTTLLTVFLMLSATTAMANSYPYTKALAAMAFQDYQYSVDNIVKGPKVELNPALGPNPSRTDLALFGLVGVGLTFLVEKYMQPGFLKTTILNAVTESERFNVEENGRDHRQFDTIMIRFRWEF